MATRRGRGDVDVPALMRELGGIGEEVPEHLAQARAVAGGRRKLLAVEVQRDVICIQRELEGVNGFPQELADVHPLDLQAELSGRDVRDIKELVDDVRLRPGIPE